ncbi:GNAT family N-acetyltransferase [Marinomonas sp. C2222]|uniref:GNAT family N-acetyltransferase n=1 Tax=Marinomonas sargassi TaxID=2984494 RepID=A0ABT2YQV1_9GAMM|nr:GNAT family N-acetyltransferase [Marinomonas sargassi]MCV2402257.1 GNAT family N-acetyltransferase [Marinomonas sargassi]
MIKIREYKESDASELWSIFYNTVRCVNIRDYTQEQVEAWAPDTFPFDIWQQKMHEAQPFIAEIGNDIVGYADLQENGLIDYFYCHSEHQGKGVGRRLMERILHFAESKGMAYFYSNVSITARPFYEKFGFKVTQEQRVQVRGQQLINFVMEKRI